MDNLDQNLIDAWHRVVAHCKADPAQARQRWRRTRTRVATRPHRAWCVALRACDTRLEEIEGVVLDPQDVRCQLPHEVMIDTSVIQQLAGPVWLRHPGVPLDEAARLLGKHREALRRWMPIRPGRTRTQRAAMAEKNGRDRMCWLSAVDSRMPLNVRYEPQKAHRRHRGMETPVVWSDGPLDPSAPRGAPPHPIWGTCWQHLAGQIAIDNPRRQVREPTSRPYRGEPRFRGWNWTCPGRSTRTPQGQWVHRPCGRPARTLYMPLPVWTLGRQVDPDLELCLDEPELAGDEPVGCKTG